jgi:alpha-glucosidase/alpha-D-xyloside xylohydrolase
VRAGAVIPLGPVRQYVDEPTTEPTTLVVYPGADATASNNEDDGRTLDYQRDPGMKIAIAWREAQRTLTLSLTPGTKMRAPEKRMFDVRLAGATATRQIAFDGRQVQVRL